MKDLDVRSESLSQEPLESQKSVEDNYDDDFIEEDLPIEEICTEDINLAISGKGIAISRSGGPDASCDSMALEEYDYMEPVERLM